MKSLLSFEEYAAWCTMQSNHLQVSDEDIFGPTRPTEILSDEEPVPSTVRSVGNRHVITPRSK